MAIMPQYTIPDDLVAALRAHYGDATAAMTDKQVGAHHLRATCGTILRAYRRRQDAAVATAKAAREAGSATRATAHATDEQAVQDAETTVDTTAQAAIDGIA